MQNCLHIYIAINISDRIQITASNHKKLLKSIQVIVSSQPCVPTLLTANPITSISLPHSVYSGSL